MKSNSKVNSEFITWLGLNSSNLKFNLVDESKDLCQQGFILSKHGGDICINSPSTVGLVAGLSELSEFGCNDNFKTCNPDLKYRAHQRWLPFDMGQKAYGQAGYDSFDKDTNNWWYDRDYWKQYLFKLAIARYNAIHLWNVHPYPVLIRFKKHPYAAYFNQERVEQNIEQFSWIVETAKSLGIRIVLMQYNIHVSQGYAKKNGLPWVDDCGWGGVDNPDIRYYTRSCLEELLELYPDLGGLMTAGELNKDAFNFYNESIIPVIKQAGNHCNLHFRVWGQQDPDGVKKLVDLIDGKIHLWHKISHEQIWVPKADYRIGKWYELTGVPVNASCGPGMAAGLNYVEGIHFDPQFWHAQLSHLKQIGGNGIGYFAGDDNYLRFPGDYQKHKEAIEARRLAIEVSWDAVGKIAWDLNRSDNNTRFDKKLVSFLKLKDEKTEIYEIACKIDSLFTQICQYHGMYEGQDLGFAGLLGARTVSTEKSQEGTFPFCGCFAWPNDGFGITDKKEVRQLALDFARDDQDDSLTQFEEFLNLIDEVKRIIEINGLETNISDYKNEGALRTGSYLHSKLVTAFIGLIKYYSMNSAIYAYGAPFGSEPLVWLDKSLDYIDRGIKVCVALKDELSKGWNVQLTYATHARHSAYYISNHCYEHLKKEKRQIEKILAELEKNKNKIDVYKKLGRSLHWYYEVFVCLPTHGGFHHSQETINKARDFAEKALFEFEGLDETVDCWKSYLQQEKGRLERPWIKLGKAETKYIELKWDGFGFESQESYTESIFELLTSCKFSSNGHLINNPQKVCLTITEKRLEICLPPLFDPDFQYIQVDETLAPHEKISPYVYKNNDHYQVSFALPESNKLFNIKIIPKDKTYICRVAWLNAPHGLCVKEQDDDRVEVDFSNEKIAVSLPFDLFKGHSNIKFNVCQSRDFWEFVVASWSPIQSVQTFLDKEQLGNVEWVG